MTGLEIIFMVSAAAPRVVDDVASLIARLFFSELLCKLCIQILLRWVSLDFFITGCWLVSVLI